MAPSVNAAAPQRAYSTGLELSQIGTCAIGKQFVQLYQFPPVNMKVCILPRP